MNRKYLSLIRRLEKHNCNNYKYCSDYAVLINAPYIPCYFCDGNTPKWDKPRQLKDIANCPGKKKNLMSVLPDFNNNWPPFIMKIWFDDFIEMAIRLNH